MEENILPIAAVVIFVAVILLVIKILKKVESESPANQSFNALAEELNASVKKNIMTGTFEGISFKCSRIPFWIQLQFPIPLELTIKKAGPGEKLWKKLGLVQSINTKDSSKDKKEIDIGVSEFFYKSVKTGDPIIIIYKQGYHHVRWLVSYEKGNP